MTASRNRLRFRTKLFLLVTGFAGLGTLGLGTKVSPPALSWDAGRLGNHRVVLHVGDVSSEFVRASIKWRRAVEDPGGKSLVLLDASRGEVIRDKTALSLSLDRLDLVFRPSAGSGNYYLYYLPYRLEGRPNYPRTRYPEPEETADAAWVAKVRDDKANGKIDRYPVAEVVAFESIDSFNSFTPLERIATPSEVESLLNTHQGLEFLLFPEERTSPIRRIHAVPVEWVKRGPGGPFRGTAERGEFYTFQIGLLATRTALDKISVEFGELSGRSGRTNIPAYALRCFNLGGVDWKGIPFSSAVKVPAGQVRPLWIGVQIPPDALPDTYQGEISISALNASPQKLTVQIKVLDSLLTDAGDSDPSRLSRLRWLDSRIALDDSVVRPFQPVGIHGTELTCLGRRVQLDDIGLPRQIYSRFSPEMTEITEARREVLQSAIRFVVETEDGSTPPMSFSKPAFVEQAEGRIRWTVSGETESLQLRGFADMEFDGTIEYRLSLSSDREVGLRDVRLEVPLRGDVARYMMGLGFRGGFRPDSYAWKWDQGKNQDSVWVGDVNAGLQISLSDENYVRPLNTNFYLLKPLPLPPSWHNDGRGGVRLQAENGRFLVTCYSGPRVLAPGAPQHFNFRLTLTPFKALDPAHHWKTRYYHRFDPVEEIKAKGADTINVHHATAINPYINYPFLRVEEMKKYVKEAHRQGMKVKIYYTVRELSNRAPELFALLSLGDEVIADGPGGGPPWLQEHVDRGYIAGWFVPDLGDAALVTSGTSRWHNYFLEGLNWLVNNMEIDGLYIDDVAFDRTVMKRARRILDRARPDAMIDLHSANQFNVRDGFANSANLYLEHFPYLERLWFGEYFDYDLPPDFWLVEVSGIPFGLMGEMLEKGGNPWRGMVYGMTGRLPHSGDPRPIWRLWDDFGIEESRMMGYWTPDCPVRTTRPELKATAYVKNASMLVAVANWSVLPVQWVPKLALDTIGLDEASARLRAPAVTGLQQEAEYRIGEPIEIPGSGGILLIVEPRR